jgi:drug/metabolite transporter (DMT)-like permease
MALPMLRAMGTIPILFCICYAADPHFWRVPWADLKLLALLGTLVCAVQQNLFNVGLMLTTASDGGIMQPAVPVFACIMAIALGREQAGWLKIGGISCAVLGTLFIVIGETYLVPTSQSDDDSSPLTSGGGGTGGAAPSAEVAHISPTHRLAGLSCFLLQCFLFSIYLLLQKPLLNRLPTLTITFYTFLFGLVGASAVGGYFVAQIDWPSLPAMWYVSILYTIFFASIAGFLLFSYATKHLPATASSMGVTLQPFMSSALGAIFLGELLTYMHIVGGLFLIAGLVTVLWSRQKEAESLARAALASAAMVAADAERRALELGVDLGQFEPIEEAPEIVAETTATDVDASGARTTSPPPLPTHLSVQLELTSPTVALALQQQQQQQSSGGAAPRTPLLSTGGEWMTPRLHRGSMDGFHVDVLGPAAAAASDGASGVGGFALDSLSLTAPASLSASSRTQSFDINTSVRKSAAVTPAAAASSHGQAASQRTRAAPPVAADEENPFEL